MKRLFIFSVVLILSLLALSCSTGGTTPSTKANPSAGTTSAEQVNPLP